MAMTLTRQQHRKALLRATADMDTQEELAFLRRFVVDLEGQVDRLLKENLQLRAELFAGEPSPSTVTN